MYIMIAIAAAMAKTNSRAKPRSPGGAFSSGRHLLERQRLFVVEVYVLNHHRVYPDLHDPESTLDHVAFADHVDIVSFEKERLLGPLPLPAMKP